MLRPGRSIKQHIKHRLLAGCRDYPSSLTFCRGQPEIDKSMPVEERSKTARFSIRRVGLKETSACLVFPNSKLFTCILRVGSVRRQFEVVPDMICGIAIISHLPIDNR